MTLFATALVAVGVLAALAAGSLVRLHSSRREIGVLEEQLVQAQKLESLGLLAGAVAHDFNNLLAAIRGYGELLLKESSGRTAERAHEILKASDRATQLTRQLLTFSRRQPHHATAIDIGELVRETGDMTRRLVGSHITIDVDVEDHAVAHGDSGRLQQVLLNLVVNARDAMPDGGVLRILARACTVEPGRRLGAAPGPYVMIAVSDTGSGVDPHIRSRIFEPFFTTKPPDLGTGLGLSTVYGIVRQHDGFINVESAPGEGATFTVYIPAEPTSSA